MSVRSRGPCRPSFPAACRTFSTSSDVKYSRLRLEALESRRGGRGEPGVAPDRRSEVFRVPPRRGTFPFSSIGERLDATIFPGEFLEDFAIRAFYTFP